MFFSFLLGFVFFSFEGGIPRRKESELQYFIRQNCRAIIKLGETGPGKDPRLGMVGLVEVVAGA